MQSTVGKWLRRDPFTGPSGREWSSSKAIKNGQSSVTINIYDMLPSVINKFTTKIGMGGVFHTGIEVYETEYHFGGNVQERSGIFERSPCDAETLKQDFSLKHLRLKKSIHMGITSLTEEEIREKINELKKEFTGNRYQFTNRNCNHFASVFTQILVGKEIPVWINRPANFIKNIYKKFKRVKAFPRRWRRREQDHTTGTAARVSEENQH